MLVGPLEKLNIAAVAAPWDGDSDWHSFDAIILRSCWNYHKKPDQFRTWIESLRQQKMTLWNPASVVLWNMDKLYLKSLEDLGVTIIPTCWVDRTDNQISLKEILEINNWPEALIKPRIGADSHDVWTTTLKDTPDHQQLFVERLGKHDLMVQPFIYEIRDGEWSFVFINGEYSHAVLKGPELGANFVQIEGDGSWAIAQPPSSFIEQSSKIISVAMSFLAVNKPFLYARVDGVPVNNQLLLMELELIEPELFLSAVPSAAEKLASSIAQRLRMTPQPT